MNIHVKFERLLIFTTMNLNANLYLTLKQEMLKVKVKDKGFTMVYKLYIHVKYERLIINT